MSAHYPDKDGDERPMVDFRSGEPQETSRFARHGARFDAHLDATFNGELRVYYRRDPGEPVTEMTAFSDPGASAVVDLGRDVHGRCHTIEVRVARLGDGTLGARVTSSLGGLKVQMDTGNSFTMTTHRPDKMPARPTSPECDDQDCAKDH